MRRVAGSAAWEPGWNRAFFAPKSSFFHAFSRAGGIAIDQRQSCGRLADALLERHRAADDHEEIVGMRPLIGHHELEMHSEKLPAEPVVVLRADDLAEPDRYDGRVPLRAEPTSIPWPATGSNGKKFMTSLRDWQSIQSIDGSIGQQAQIVAEIPGRACGSRRSACCRRASATRRGAHGGRARDRASARGRGFRSRGTSRSCGRPARFPARR